MKTDGYIFTPELLQWKYFRRPTVVQVLIHVLLSSTHNEASGANLSLRDLAQQLHTTVKAIRCAIDVLVQERIVTKCASPRSSTILYINSSNKLSHCIIPWQNDQRAQQRAQRKAQKGARLGAQIENSQTSVSQGCKVYYQNEEGTDWGTTLGTTKGTAKGTTKNRAQQKAQIGAQFQDTSTPYNPSSCEDKKENKGTDNGIGKGTLTREGKKEKTETKEIHSPEPPLKEKKERKERKQEKAPPPPQKKEKEKKSEISESEYGEVLRLFNKLFLGTQVKAISKMTPERKQMVAKFVSDYSYADIEPMLRKALRSDFLMGRKDGKCCISFNWLFTPGKYVALMEDTYENPTVLASAMSKPSTTPPQQSQPQPRQQETLEQIEARERKKQEDDEKAKTAELRKRYLEYIEASRDDPKGSMGKIVRKAYEDGTLASLGIVWNPTAEEENQTLIDLDDQTQSYLKSILSD